MLVHKFKKIISKSGCFFIKKKKVWYIPTIFFKKKYYLKNK